MSKTAIWIWSNLSLQLETKLLSMLPVKRALLSSFSVRLLLDASLWFGRWKVFCQLFRYFISQANQITLQICVKVAATVKGTQELISNSALLMRDFFGQSQKQSAFNSISTNINASLVSNIVQEVNEEMEDFVFARRSVSSLPHDFYFENFRWSVNRHQEIFLNVQLLVLMGRFLLDQMECILNQVVFITWFPFQKYNHWDWWVVFW